MEENNYFDELIVLYLSNELNTDEEIFVLKWINSNEQNRKRFEEIENTWKLLCVKKVTENIDVDVEWNLFKHALSQTQKLHSLYEDGSIGKDFADEETPQRKGNFYKFFISTAVAASILLIITFAWRLTNNTQLEKPVANNTSKENNSLRPVVRNEVNTTNKIRLIVLSDGSEVNLFDKSELTYSEPFTGNKREITLKGKASFKVAKDKTKPFTVFSGDLSTTALGTVFTVTAFENSDNITIRLHEGKVVVRSSDIARRKMKDDFYLLPGQELVYDNLHSSVKIRRFKPTGNAVKRDSIKKEIFPAENPTVPSLGKGSWYMFNNQSLAQVFDQLENMFDVDIVYSKKDVSKMYFIGTFHSTDSVDNILNQIARLNNLKLTKQTNKFIISK